MESQPIPEKLRILNQSFLRWLTDQVSQHPDESFTSACQDYIEYCSRFGVKTAKNHTLAKEKAAAGADLQPAGAPADTQGASDEKQAAGRPDRPFSGGPKLQLPVAGAASKPAWATSTSSPPASPIPFNNPSIQPSLFNPSSSPSSSSNPSFSAPGPFNVASAPASSTPGHFKFPNVQSDSTALTSTAPAPLFGMQPSSTATPGPSTGLFGFQNTQPNGVATASSSGSFPAFGAAGGTGPFGSPNKGTPNFNFSPGSTSPAFGLVASNNPFANFAHPTAPAAQGDGGHDGDGADAEAGQNEESQVEFNSADEILFKAQASLFLLEDQQWKNRGSGVLTLRRSKAEGEGASSKPFMRFTSGTGQVVLNSGLPPGAKAEQAAGKNPRRRIVPYFKDEQFKTALFQFKSDEDSSDFTNKIQQYAATK